MELESKRLVNNGSLGQAETRGHRVDLQSLPIISSPFSSHISVVIALFQRETLHLNSFFFFFFFVFCLFKSAPAAHEVPRLGVELELQLPVYATAIATLDPSCNCDLHHTYTLSVTYSALQGQILNPQSKAGDQTYILMDTLSGS